MLETFEYRQQYLRTVTPSSVAVPTSGQEDDDKGGIDNMIHSILPQLCRLSLNLSVRESQGARPPESIWQVCTLRLLCIFFVFFVVVVSTRCGELFSSSLRLLGVRTPSRFLPICCLTIRSTHYVFLGE